MILLLGNQELNKLTYKTYQVQVDENSHITSGEIGYVFRQNQIIRMDYVGGATVFRLSVISPNRGAVYGRTVCQDNRRVFFYADDGFFELSMEIQ